MVSGHVSSSVSCLKRARIFKWGTLLGGAGHWPPVGDVFIFCAICIGNFPADFVGQFIFSWAISFRFGRLMNSGLLGVQGLISERRSWKIHPFDNFVEAGVLLLPKSPC